MIWLLIGVGVGVALLLGYLPQVGQVLLDASSEISAYVLRGAQNAAGAVPGNLDGVAEVVLVAFTVALPGLLAASLFLLARGSMGVRRAVGLVLSIGATAALLTLDWPTSAMVAGGLLAVAALVSLLSGALLVMPLSAAGTLLLGTHVLALLSGEVSAVGASAEELHAIAGMGSEALWRWAMVLVSAAPAVLAVRALLRGWRK